jgi:hypothetical protein
VKRCQDECEVCEGWVVYRGFLLDNRLTLEDSLVRLQITGVCDEGRIRDGFVSVCVDTSPHTETTPKPDLNPIRT